MVVASLGIVVRRWVPVRRFESISAALKVILRPSVASAKSSRSCEKTMGFWSSVNMESPGCQGDQSIRPARRHDRIEAATDGGVASTEAPRRLRRGSRAFPGSLEEPGRYRESLA